jgi:hypothetical protein
LSILLLILVLVVVAILLLVVLVHHPTPPTVDHVALDGMQGAEGLGVGVVTPGVQGDVAVLELGTLWRARNGSKCMSDTVHL